MPRSHPTPSSSRGKTPQRSSSRWTAKQEESVPQIYQDMLVEISSSSGVEEARRRPTKRRKVGERRVTWVDSGEKDVAKENKADEDARVDEEVEETSGKKVQTAFVSDGSDDSDMEWEEVDLQQNTPGPAPAAASSDDDEPLQLTLGDSCDKGKKSVAASRRKPVTAAERRWRLSIHKVHVLCLLSHVQLRNLWLNDADVQVNSRLT
jgi:xeroderma pigmentosum group C-complementing protein